MTTAVTIVEAFMLLKEIRVLIGRVDRNGIRKHSYLHHMNTYR